MFINIKEDLITMKRKRFSRLLFLMLTIMITVTFYQPAQAASGKYTGTYTKTWSVSSNMTVTIKPSYSVIVNKVTSTKVRLQLENWESMVRLSMRLLPLQQSVKETQFLLSGKIHGAIPALEH